MGHGNLNHRLEFEALRVLVVEDNFLVAEELAATLENWGCDVVGPLGRVEPALKIVEMEALDAAVLDVNLGDELSFPIAAALHAREVPFVFLTGHTRSGVFPREYDEVTKLSKPLQPEALADALARYLLSNACVARRMNKALASCTS